MINYRYKIFLSLFIIFSLALILFILLLNVKVENFQSTFISVYQDPDKDLDDNIVVYLDLKSVVDKNKQIKLSNVKSIKYFYNNAWIIYNQKYHLKSNKIILSELKWEDIGNLFYLSAIVELDSISAGRYLWSMF